LLKEIPANSKVVVNGAFFILAKMNKGMHIKNIRAEAWFLFPFKKGFS
jgi:hypothetical protein